jgi:uncharacterized membrane protein
MTTVVKIVQWIPRILCILTILVAGVLALDAFAPLVPMWQQIGGFLLHLIPACILVALLIVAWKRELIGGILFILLGVAVGLVVYNADYHQSHMEPMKSGFATLVAFPFILVGGLFLLTHLLKKKQSRILANERAMTDKENPSTSVHGP